MGDAPRDDLPILIRKFGDGPFDRNYIRSSWLTSHASSALARTLGRRAYFTGHHALIDDLLERTTVRIACSVTHHATIVGWACVEETAAGVVAVHYVYVGEDFRRRGVARRLLDGVGDRVPYTHRTDVCKVLPIPEGWWFNAYRAFCPEGERRKKEVA